jgi:DNA-directed RNA polymerase specialized sigma24 family protein
MKSVGALSAEEKMELIEQKIDFDALVAGEQKRVFVLCLRLLRDRDEADSATQDVFVDAYRTMENPRKRAIKEPAKWLTRVALNTCYDRLRSRRWRFWQRHSSNADAEAQLRFLPAMGPNQEDTAAALSIAVAQQGPPGQRGPAPDPLRQLNNALQQAGAPALTDSQSQQISALIENFRTSSRPAPPSSAVQQARSNYETAIVNGDLAAATAQIPTLTGEQASNAPARMQAEAALAISILNVLQSNGNQLALLQKSMNTSQLARLLLSFAGAGGPGPAKK